MKNNQNDELPSPSKYFDSLVFGDASVLESTIQSMKNPQLIEFYDYVVEKVETCDNKEGSDRYWLASFMLEDMQAVQMYKSGKFYVDTTLSNESKATVEECELTPEEIVEIQKTVELLEQRRKDKKNPIKALAKFFKNK